MGNMEYDTTKLRMIKGLNVEVYAINFDHRQAYFDELTTFVGESRLYLRSFTPSVVLYSEPVRQDFFKETRKIRETLVLLGMTHSAATLQRLDEAAVGGSEKILADGLRVFYSEMDIMAKSIAAACVDKADVSMKSEKPVILAVDDKLNIFHTIAMLRDSFMVIGLSSGEIALKAIEKYTPALFLLSIEMPQMNGYELARLVRQNKKFSNTPILFLTKSVRGDAFMAVKYGGNEYVTKPLNKEVLLSKIEQYLQK